jgi:3',5'-cyclic AMP phosphodiesterase CpdA
MKQNKPVLSFGVIADLQYCDESPFKNRYYRNSPTKLLKAIDHLNEQKPEFIINLGDIIDRDWSSFDTILPLFRRFQSPVYHVLGNHDYEVEEQRKPEVASRIGTRQYFHFSKSGWRFIILDGNEISTFANLPGTTNHRDAEAMLQILEEQDKINANFWNGGLGIEQLAWLEKCLSKSHDLNEKVMICCHYPVYPPDKHNLLNNEEVLKILKNYKGVKMWINGHNHKGNYGLFEGIHFVNVRGMVEGAHDVAWSVVDIYEKEIVVNGFGTEISAKLLINK